MHQTLVIVAALAAFASCVPGGGFACEDDEQCVSGGVSGTCESVGYCSFPDPSCADGRRFGDRAPDELAGTCVAGDTPADDAAVPVADASGSPDGPAAADAGTPIDAASGEVVASFGEGEGTSFAGVTVDGWIEAALPGANHGGGNQIYTQVDPLQHGTLRFDLSALPPGLTVTAAELHVHTPNGTGPSGTIEIYALLEEWSEGGLDGEAGAASWNERAAGTPWTTAGAGAPGSRAGVALTSFSPGSASAEYVVDLPASVVQEWAVTPATNQGLIFVAVGAGAKLRLGSSEGAVSRRPELRVTYH